MKNTFTQTLCLVTTLGLPLLVGCSHRAEEKVDREIAYQEPIENKAELDRSVISEIANAENIPVDQRNQLLNLRERTNSRLQILQSESLKLRAILVENMLATPYAADEVKVVKNRLKKNEELRLATLFTSIDEANKILGRPAPIIDDRRRAATRERPPVMREKTPRGYEEATRSE